MTKIYGHRGAKGTYPENTLLSFKKALEHGVDGLELDVHMTKDGEVVVIHDETLDRTTNGTGWIKELTLEDIKNVSAGSPFTHFPEFDKKWENERVPTLEEVLELMASYPEVELNIELKTYVFSYEGIEQKVLDIVERYGNGRKIIYSSFHLPTILRLKQFDPNANIAWLLDNGVSLPQDYLNILELESFHLNKTIILSELESRDHQLFHDLYNKVRIWTVNEINEIKILLDLQVDAIITDFPERAISLKNERIK